MATCIGATPVFVACQNGYLDVVRFLIDKGAGKDTATCIGATPFNVASQNGHLDLARLLIEKGADKDVQGHRKESSRDACLVRGYG